jgi:hypothetical protein
MNSTSQVTSKTHLSATHRCAGTGLEWAQLTQVGQVGGGREGGQRQVGMIQTASKVCC